MYGVIAGGIASALGGGAMSKLFGCCQKAASGFFFSSRRRHTRYIGDWSSDVCSSDLLTGQRVFKMAPLHHHFELIGWSEPKVITRFIIIAIIFALFSLTTLKLR